MSGASAPAPADGARRRFRRHAIAFVAIVGVLHVLNVATGPPWWAFWPLAGWGLLFGVHYLFYKATRVDERWTEERMEDVRSKSYDRAHIDAIAARRDAGGNKSEDGPTDGSSPRG